MLKEEARILYRKKRKALSFAERAKSDDLMLIQFQKLDLPFIHSLLSFWPIEENNEPNTHLFTDYLEFRNPALSVSYPRTDFSNNNMEAVQVDVDTPFQLKDHNIREPLGGTVINPATIDMVLVPLLICDKMGYRVGYGKGFYDKFLAGVSEDCIKIGFSYFEPIDKIEGKHDFDIPLNICITPQNVYVFNFS
ncbi:MAG: 5-formyltetrahydrofolate cyclo-ligase [Chitinophagaceae bacterium]|nr:5-formyltetrahydrofolate cyclo-ligase [Chitinophagaceae bacterium]